MWKIVGVFTLIVLVVAQTTASITHLHPVDLEDEMMQKVVQNCTKSQDRIACFSDKAAKAIERALNWDIPLFEGISLIRNQEKLNTSQEARSLETGFSRLTSTLNDFLTTHTFTVDFSESNRQARRGGGGGHGGGGHGGFMGINRRTLRREKKYIQYAFMVLLGIFGLTGPIVMKTLAVMAAKALLASKAALIIVGSVALKKIFDNDHKKGHTVKVHTAPHHYATEEELDRLGYNHIPSGDSSSGFYSSPVYSNSFSPYFIKPSPQV